VLWLHCGGFKTKCSYWEIKSKLVSFCGFTQFELRGEKRPPTNEQPATSPRDLEQPTTDFLDVLEQATTDSGKRQRRD